MKDSLQIQQNQILSHLQQLAPNVFWEVHVFSSLSSTNDYLLRLAESRNVHANICQAIEQTAGRGRLGRRWQGREGQAIMFSIGWNNAADRPLSLLAGYAVLQALHQLSVPDLSLKWPNDILYNGAKLAGILVESRGGQAVIGIGLNLAGANALSVTLGRDVADLSAYAIEQTFLLAQICAQISKVVARYDEMGAEKFIAAWDAWHEYHHSDVWVLSEQQKQAATVLGLAPDGALRVRIGGRVHIINSGEVSLRE